MDNHVKKTALIHGHEWTRAELAKNFIQHSPQLFGPTLPPELVVERAFDIADDFIREVNAWR